MVHMGFYQVNCVEYHKLCRVTLFSGDSYQVMMKPVEP